MASHTAIISDLHLCEAEPVNLRFPLWKKFKTRQFFFDDTFEVFLKSCEEKAQGASVELVLNGDIFDFDSVLRLPDEPVFHVSGLEKRRGLFPIEERSRFKIEVILKDHTPFEATTSALGDCRECIAYRTGATTGKGSRRHDDTVSREIKGSSATPGGSEKAGTGRQ
ncbi:hypothetical protein AB1A81_00250 [Bdellovibrio bacteriovorus]|uniref:hypothetical protein n=1 Tax=Bdellovibrio bacteriovorus TaxID=959 RepID=UPI00345BE5B8